MVNLWSAIEKDAPSNQGWAELLSSNQNYVTGINQALADVLLKPKFTVEYTHASPLNQSPTSNVRLIGDFKFGKHRNSNDELIDSGDYQNLLTFNLALTLYEKVPRGLRVGQLRDAQAALQYDRKLGPANWLNRPVFSLAGYYQYQINNAILEFDKSTFAPGTDIPLPRPADEVLNSSGHIGIFQAKLTLRLSETVSIPLAVSWSNRTELLKASAVRGQFGISIDLNKLLAKTGATNSQ
ncbi:hypothetical protein [Bryobacter aggregatus]|uniref:hypothetical protein n=1 Tax=Bryobacter aggregatus TaxID=360054 RepID=UPI0012BA58DB|nr:hypothetical protein [Bryobacter aggregatus]